MEGQMCFCVCLCFCIGSFKQLCICFRLSVILLWCFSVVYLCVSHFWLYACQFFWIERLICFYAFMSFCKSVCWSMFVLLLLSVIVSNCFLPISLSSCLLCECQTLANNSTWYCYSKITQKSGNIWGQIPGQIRDTDLTRVILESVLKNLAFVF